MLERYQHVIWDWNGTLLDDARLCVDVMNGMLAERGMHEIDPVLYRDIFGFPVENYYRKLGFEFTDEPFESLATQYCELYDARVMECGLHKKVGEIAAKVSKRAVSQSILSSHRMNSLEQAIELFRLTEYFQEVVGQDNTHAVGKVQTGRELMDRLGAGPATVVLIGDTVHDHEVAKELGIDCILVSHGHNSRQRLCEIHDVVIESLQFLE